MKNKKYFSREYPRECRFCERGQLVADGSAVVCVKKGIVPSAGVCRKYVFDPLKREPLGAPGIGNYDEKDFSLE